MLLLVTSATDLQNANNSVPFSSAYNVDACCDKQYSLTRDSLRYKQTSTLSAINYFTVKIVDDTPL